MKSCNLIRNARRLRKDSTDAEKLLWNRLRAKQIDGYKFRRQHPIGRYIVDFVCLSKKLIIELDGGQHAIDKEKDEIRGSWLRSEGYKILRFWNNEIFENTDGVLKVIYQYLSSPSP